MISIRWRLTILLWFSLGLLFITVGAAVFFTVKSLLTERFDETLTTKARALITASEVDGGDFEIDLTVRDFAGFGKNGRDYFEIRRSGGTRFLRSPSLRDSGDNGFPDVPRPEADAPRLGDLRLPDGKKARYYTQYIYPKDDKKNRFQDLYIIVASPVEKLRSDLALLATALGLGGAVTLLLMVPLIRLGLGHGLAPVSRLAAEVGAAGPESLHTRLDENSFPAELAPVASGLNDWLARLEHSFERERLFTSHAAHELRTPIAELRSMAELGAMSAEEATPALCSSMVDVTGELARLLDSLNQLAKTEAGSQPVCRLPIVLSESVAAVATRLAADAAGRKIVLDVDVPRTKVTGDPVLWTTALTNLLGNAIAYAPAGSTVKIRADQRTLTVANPAPGLAEHDLARMFDRFWRKDPARHGYGHSGLGLSIVNNCLHSFGWSCAAHLTDDARLVMTVRFSNDRR